MNTKMIEAFDPLIKKIASNFYNADYEELIQVGRIGLYNAYKHYDNNSNTKFSSFAYQYIFGEMYQLSILNKTIKPNKDLLKLNKLIDKTKILLTQKLNHEPSIDEISSYLNIDSLTISNAIKYNEIILSLDKEMDEDTNLYNKLGNTFNNDLKILLDDSFKILDNNEKDIIKYRYYNDLTQSETANLLGISQVSVSRYEKKSLNKIRNYIINE